MAVTGCARKLKYSFIALNLLLVLAGGASIALGAWSLASKYGTAKLSLLTDTTMYKGLSIATILGGCFIVVNAFFGCVGSVKENKPLLAVYATVMIAIIVLFVTATALIFVYRDNLKGKLDSQLEKTLTESYGIDPTTADITRVWDDMQTDLRCCGVEGNVFGNRSWFLWKSSKWFQAKGDKFVYVPEACCNRLYGLGECQRLNSRNSGQPVQQNYTEITEENPALYSTGCLDKIIERVERNIAIIAGTLAGILAINLLCATISLSLHFCITSDRWTIK